MHPFVALMRTYCIDYTNSHDLSVCDTIMAPDYKVCICGMTLERDSSYKPSVETVFARFPGLGLVVHELATNGDRLVMRFSEHGATTSGTMACWSGIGLYDWNGRMLTHCRVEQDFWSQNRQLRTGVPDPLDAPHLDPWMSTAAVAADPAAEQTVRQWLAAGELAAVGSGRIDEKPAREHRPVVDAEVVDVADIFSAGDRVAFHATVRGAYIGGLDPSGAGVDAESAAAASGHHDAIEIGAPVALDVAGVVTMDGDRLAELHAVTDRFGASIAMRAAGAAR